MGAAPHTAAAKQPGDDGGLARPGELVGGRYRVERRLGQGGMGTVFKVVDQARNLPLALKQLGGKLAARRRRVRKEDTLRFRREFHTMARLRHPRVVEVYEYGVAEEVVYYTMELLDGRDLRDLGQVDTAVACSLLRDVAAALAFLHARRLLHRDLAPRNVRCTTDGRAKLIDFGVLATVGICGDVAGTPPFITPENLRGLPLDHRADLFGLGALAYWVLTGRHAFPARNPDDLEALWRTRPAYPSHYASGIPESLDTLVMSLLSLEPLGRPASAAEVIDRLSAIGSLERMPETEATHGYLASAAMVGRDREMGLLVERVQKATEGHGRAVLIEAPSGTGKSRLLREIGLEAQVAGATVLRADSESAGRGPYGLVRQLGRELLASASGIALDKATPRAPVITRVLPELLEHLGPVEVAPAAGELAEERLRMQAELVGWFRDVAEQRTLVFLIDDVQRCDEASAAVLAALAHDALDTHIMMAIALRTDETIRAPAAVAAVQDAGIRIRLRGLSRKHVGALVQTLFGDVANIRRLARWMHDLAGGSPLHCTELARNLVDREVIRFVDGEWVVPESLEREELPSGLAEAMDARIASLAEAPRAMAEALSIYGGEFSLKRAVLVTEERDEAELFAALDELLFEEILVGSGRKYRFRHDGLREALLRSLDVDRRRRLHLWVGETLAGAGAADAEHEAEIGWHLFHGGETVRGAEYLETAGRRLYEAQSFSDAIAPLEAALGVYDAQGGSPKVCLELRHMLLMSGCMADREVALRHADATVAAFQEYSGVALAARLGRFLGRHLALAVAVFWACIRWLFARPSRRGLDPIEALRTFFVVVGYAATVYSLSYDIPGVRALLRRVDPLAIFKNRVPYAVYLLTCNLLAVPLGQIADVRRNATRLLEILDTDHVTPISEMDRKTGGGGALFMLTLMAVSEHDPAYVGYLERLEALELRFYDIGAHQARISYHRLRGEEELALEIEAQVEVLFVQLGSVWQMESWLPIISAFAYALTRDVLGLKRTIEALVRLVEQGHHFEGFLELARGEYHRERGELKAAETALQKVLSIAEEENRILPQVATAALAEALLAAGHIERATEMAKKAVAITHDPATGHLTYRLRSQRVLALAEAAAGDVEAAARRLDETLAENASRPSPTITGGLHEARARVALLAGDAEAFEAHRRATERWFKPTRNPSLIARAERLGRRPGQARDVGMSVVASEAVTSPGKAQDPGLWVSSVFSACRGRSERAERALEMLLQSTSGLAGYLFLLEDTDLRLVAPSYGVEPPDALKDALLAALEAAKEGEDATIADVSFSMGTERRGWQPVILTTRLGDRIAAVGAAAIVEGPVALSKPHDRLVEEIAQALLDVGDVTAGRMTVTSVTSGESDLGD